MNQVLRYILHIKFYANIIIFYQCLPTVYISSESTEIERCLQYRYFILKFIHCIFYGEINALFDQQFSQLISIHTYGKRYQRFTPVRVDYEFEKNLPIYNCVCFYNHLPEYLIRPQLLFTMKQKFKEFCIDSNQFVFFCVS